MQSENPAVRQFAEVAASDSLTARPSTVYTERQNRENRAAFEQAYGRDAA